MVEGVDEQGLSELGSEKLIPPLRFACVSQGIYRGGYPKKIFYPFLNKLHLRTILSIGPEPIDPIQPSNTDSINYVHLVCGAEQQKSKKKREVPITEEHVWQVLKIVENPKNWPLYLHCLNGQQATSLVVACLRVRQHWSLRSAFAEYARFSDYDRQDLAFVETFREKEVKLDTEKSN